MGKLIYLRDYLPSKQLFEKSKESYLEETIKKLIDTVPSKEISPCLGLCYKLWNINNENPFCGIGMAAYRYSSADRISSYNLISWLELALREVNRGLKIDPENKQGNLYKFLILSFISKETPEKVKYHEMELSAKNTFENYNDSPDVLVVLFEECLETLGDEGIAEDILKRLEMVGIDRGVFQEYKKILNSVKKSKFCLIKNES